LSLTWRVCLCVCRGGEREERESVCVRERDSERASPVAR